MLASLLASCALLMGGAAAPAAAPLLWFEDGHLTKQATQVLAALRAAETAGLEPADYEVTASASDAAAFDAALSRALARYVEDLHVGRLDPRSVGFHLPKATPEAFDVARAVRQLATAPDVRAALDGIEPRPVPYKRLKAALATYRRLSAEVGSITLPPLPAKSVGAGDEYAGAPELRRFLAILGDAVADDAAADDAARDLDPALVEAIRSFQRRHGLDDDGVLGARTFAALTTPLARRVEQIELSMERWRWLGALGRPDIVVNIPQFMLIALPPERDGAGEPLEMRAIVGQTYSHTRTPVFATAITQVVFQPYWDVPSSILHRELLPRIRKNASLLDRYGMEIVRGEADDARVIAASPDAIERLAAGELRLRQRPGPLNALGPVKFIMPNPFSVYLHATPERALFDRSQRTFSHGCIRVSEPAALAEYVLRKAPGNWNAEAIDAAMCGTQMLRIRLDEPVRVIVFYSTAVATRSAGVMFFDDVYGHDRKLQALLAARKRP